MKVIDLYKNMANNKELPQKIKISGYDYIFTLREDCSGYKWYGEETTHDDFGEAIHQNLEFVLKQEIEIIEDYKKPQKELKELEKISEFGNTYGFDNSNILSNELIEIRQTINELIENQNEIIKEMKEEAN